MRQRYFLILALYCGCMSISLPPHLLSVAHPTLAVPGCPANLKFLYPSRVRVRSHHLLCLSCPSASVPWRGLRATRSARLTPPSHHRLSSNSPRHFRLPTSKTGRGRCNAVAGLIDRETANPRPTTDKTHCRLGGPWEPELESARRNMRLHASAVGAVAYLLAARAAARISSATMEARQYRRVQFQDFSRYLGGSESTKIYWDFQGDDSISITNVFLHRIDVDGRIISVVAHGLPTCNYTSPRTPDEFPGDSWNPGNQCLEATSEQGSGSTSVETRDPDSENLTFICTSISSFSLSRTQKGKTVLTGVNATTRQRPRKKRICDSPGQSTP